MGGPSPGAKKDAEEAADDVAHDVGVAAVEAAGLHRPRLSTTLRDSRSYLFRTWATSWMKTGMI
jgi:hypothetical protein